MPQTLIGNPVRIESSPLSPWVPNAVIAVVIAGIACVLLSYLLPYIHRKGDKFWIMLPSVFIFALSLMAVAYEYLPAFTKDVGRGAYVVHVMEPGTKEPKSFISVSFTTPGSLEKEAELLVQNGFTCGSSNNPDFRW